jgi:hypothetical protein
VTQQLEAVQDEPSPELPPRPGRRREVVAAVLCLLAMAVVAVAITTVVAPSHSASAQLPRAGSSRSAAGATRSADQLAAIRSLLRQRSAALVHHDRAAFLATVDPAASRFRRHEAAMFTNLRRVRFASWSYTVGPTSAQLPASERAHYRARTWAPASFSVHYRIAGFDQHPTDLAQYPTFVDRSGRWYLGSLTDFDRRGRRSATDLWDYTPVHVVRRHSVLVLGPRSELGTMAAVADQMAAAVPRVDAVWGNGWARRVVVLVPATQREMALIDEDSDNLDQIAALTSSEIASVHGRSAPVGDRVTVNPANWPKLATVGAAIVLTHELTHVATREYTGPQTPKWLAEGFADYVGFLGTDIPPIDVASGLASRVRAGDAPKRLPPNRDFRGTNQALPQAYESGWLACRYIAERYGQAKLVRFYRSVGTSTGPRADAVPEALRDWLGLTPARFTALWRGYVRAQLT